MLTLIPITETHIDRGEPGAHMACPISLGWGDATSYKVSVTPALTTVWTGYVTQEGHRVIRFAHDPGLRGWIERYDYRRLTEDDRQPFTMGLCAPPDGANHAFIAAAGQTECHIHPDNAPVVEQDDDRCTATLKSGKRCNRPRMFAVKTRPIYCKQHAKAAAATG